MNARSSSRIPRRRPSPRGWARRCWALITVVLVVVGADDARALTTPIAGAVAFPSNVPLVLPFPAGEAVEILSGYGPAMGSSLHADTNDCCKANDHYALDLVYANQPNSGKGLPILAPLPGKVIRAGWATAGWANYGLRVILEHDLGDGHVYHSVYAHLNAVDAAVVEGADVAVGQPLGELGQSCQGQLSCGSFSTPHLHWVIHRDSLVGGSGTGGSYGGNAVVPEPLDGAEDLVQGQVIVSTNTGIVVCGDGFCSPGEDNASCPDDCPVCEPIPARGRTVDDQDLCFSRAGTPDYWHEESLGHDGSLWWTIATAEAAPDNTGTWQLTFDEAGDYVLEAYVEPAFAGSQQARYDVTHAGTTEPAVIDQSASSGWIELGTFAFAGGGEQSVVLADDTGEDVAGMRKLVFDAIRLTRVGGSGAGGSGGGSTSSGAGGEGDVGSTGAGGSAEQSPAAADTADEGGCGCRVARGDDDWSGLALLAFGVGAAIVRRYGPGSRGVGVRIRM